jgi:hypothetical protein
MAKFSEINPNTKQVWRLQELHDAYSDSQKQLHHVQGLAKTKPLSILRSRICKEGRILIPENHLQKKPESLWVRLKKSSNQTALSFRVKSIHP